MNPILHISHNLNYQFIHPWLPTTFSNFHINFHRLLTCSKPIIPRLKYHQNLPKNYPRTSIQQITSNLQNPRKFHIWKLTKLKIVFDDSCPFLPNWCFLAWIFKTPNKFPLISWKIDEKINGVGRIPRFGRGRGERKMKDWDGIMKIVNEMSFYI